MPPDKEKGRNSPNERERAGEGERDRERERARDRARERTKTKSKSARERAGFTIDRFLQMPGMLEKMEQLVSARRAIGEAISVLRFGPPKMRRVLKQYDIKIRDRDYYLAIALKESSLNPRAVSRSNARGYFQIKFDPSTGRSRALDDVNQTFGLNLSEQDVANSDQKNAMAGILYWHICRDVQRRKRGLQINEDDRDRTAAFAYKLGPNAFANLWQTLKPGNFREFGRKLGALLKAKFPDELAVPAGGAETINDPTYAINYTSYLQVRRDIPRGTMMKIGSREYDVPDLIGTLRYGELIFGMQQVPKAPVVAPPRVPTPPSKKPASPRVTRRKPAPPKAPPPPKPKPASKAQPPKPAPRKAPPAVKPPPKAPPVAPPKPPTAPPRGIPGRDYDTIRPDHWMWSIADGLLARCTDEYKIPYFQDTNISIGTKTWFLISVITRYNKEVKRNPAFKDADPDDKDPQVSTGATVYLPPKNFVENALKESEREIPETREEPLPREVPMYTGPGARVLERQGKEVLSYSGKHPPFTLKIPSYLPKGGKKSKKLNPNQLSKNGIMRGRDVRYIVLHSTEGIIDPTSRLYRRQMAHYLVKRDGTVELVRNERVAIDHAGVWSNKYENRQDPASRAPMAIWNGDQNISLHSIGIEVETTSVGQYNDRQYAVIGTLIKWIGSRYKISKGNVLTHSMIGVSDLLKYAPAGGTPLQHERFQRGRKQDPRGLKWARLDLPDNYRRTDPDVALGTVGSNLATIKDGIACKTQSGWCGNTNSGMIAGLEAGEKIWNQLRKRKMWSADLKRYGIKPETANRAVIDSDANYRDAVLKNLPRSCPDNIKANQVVLEVYYYSFDGKIHRGQLILDRRLAADIEEVFALAFKEKFPIGKVIPIAHYNWNDQNSMSDNNTSAFNYRKVAGRGTLSRHAYGFAIDLNPRLNPWIDRSGATHPPRARHQTNKPGTLHKNHPIVKKFKELGWTWGGDWQNEKDYQHFGKVLPI